MVSPGLKKPNEEASFSSDSPAFLFMENENH
jgi:hypothetical protein